MSFNQATHESMFGSGSRYSIPFVVFVLALLVRVVFIPFSILRINPYSTADAIGFATAGELISQQIIGGESPFYLEGFSSTYENWGLILSPFWLLPGPSEIYAHFFVATLGAIAVYNIALIGQYYYTPQAGLVAALPFIFYPTIVLTQASLLREAAVLFGITTAARFLIIPSARLKRWHTVVIVVLSLYFAVLARPENLPLYAGALGLGILLWALSSYSKFRPIIILSSFPVGLLFIYQYGSSAIEHIRRIRNWRARGRSVYLNDITLGSTLEFLVFSWIGALYFLYTPFPWMIELSRDLVVGVEAIISIIYTIAAVAGFRYAINKEFVKTTALALAFFVGVVFYGYGTANVGTAARHRPMFLWVIFIFGGVGIAHYLTFRIQKKI